MRGAAKNFDIRKAFQYLAVTEKTMYIICICCNFSKDEVFGEILHIQTFYRNKRRGIPLELFFSTKQLWFTFQRLTAR